MSKKEREAEQESPAHVQAQNVTKSLPFTPGKYMDVEPTWPTEGKHILATFDSNSIIVYQAYNSAIANYATAHQTFSGCSHFSESRMTWIKTNFLWMMYRSDWARKDTNQSHILAITISREGFEEILRNATTKDVDNKSSDVRLQWDPDHDPFGEKDKSRRAIQLGLRNKILQQFLQNWILRIDDITDFVVEQREWIDKKRLDLLQIPNEKVYKIQNNDDDLIKHIQLDQFD